MAADEFRILAIDPGDKRIGVAVSDPTQTIASPVTILEHKSRDVDARTILEIAENYQAGLILVGQALDWDGKVSFQGKKSLRLAEVLRSLGNIPVKLWDEYGSTATAKKARLKMNLPRKKRQGPPDDLAAVIILQSYLDAQQRLEDMP